MSDSKTHSGLRAKGDFADLRFALGAAHHGNFDGKMREKAEAALARIEKRCEVLGEREVRLIRALGAHRKVNPDAYRGLGLTITEETAMAAALAELEEQLEALKRDRDIFRRSAEITERERSEAQVKLSDLKEQLQAVQEDHEATTERLRERRDENKRLLEQLEVLSENNRHTHANLDFCIEQRTRLEEQLGAQRRALQDIEAYFDHHFNEGDLEYQAVLVARAVLNPAKRQT